MIYKIGKEKVNRLNKKWLELTVHMHNLSRQLFNLFTDFKRHFLSIGERKTNVWSIDFKPFFYSKHL